MFVKISSVAALPDYILLVGFTTGEYKQFDLKPLIGKYAPFKSLAEIGGLYEQVKIDVGGYGLIWNDDLDIAADGIYEKGTLCEPPTDIEVYKQKLIDELVAARKSVGISQKQLAILSGIPQPCIARTEKGITDTQLTTLLKILAPLGLTLSVAELKKP